MRIKELQKTMKEKKIDLAVFFNLNHDAPEPNIIYFSQYSGTGVLVVPSKKPAFLITPGMELERAKQESTIRPMLWRKGLPLFEFIANKLKQRKIKRKVVGIDKSIFTLESNRHLKKSFRKSKTKDISSLCQELRKIKTDSELKLIRKSCSIASRIMSDCIKNFSKFNTESDVVNFLIIQTIKNNAELAFNPIVASGKGSAQPHYSLCNQKLKKGFCVIDFGVKYKGYCSDITRTLYIGNPSEKEKYYYNLVLDTQKEILNEISTGVRCSYLFNIASKNLGKNFNHGLGHGLGVKIHELPNLMPKTKEKIEKGMVLTVEPGIYFAGRFGIRIEDDVLVTGNGISILTRVDKKLKTFK